MPYDTKEQFKNDLSTRSEVFQLDNTDGPDSRLCQDDQRDWKQLWMMALQKSLQGLLEMNLCTQSTLQAWRILLRNVEGYYELVGD